MAVINNAIVGAQFGAPFGFPDQGRITAYENAKLQGFLGSEAEFYERLAAIIGGSDTSNLTAYQAASAEGYIGTSQEFYAELAERMMGNAPATDAQTGIKVRNGNISTTLGDGSRNVLVA